MPTERASAKAIFDEAAEIARPELRAAYLDQACGGDADLRAHVEALLHADAVAGSFLERFADLGASASPEFDPAVDTTFAANPTEPASASAPAALAPAGGTRAFDASGPSLASAPARPFVEGPGSVIGPYKLLEKLGEGGMGVVYLAEQARPVRRRVALKVIKPGMDTDQVVARFEAERQALAMMDHAGIAKVLDAGATDSGRPFFVMELVSGVPITEYCDAAQLTTKERLELFIPICQAVQHAHQKGIIHRDIKPSNVLVAMQDGKPVTKVIDFGIAKAVDQRLTEKTFFTQHGAIVGTLEYMSPEQAEMSAMDLDTRTDVYALGVLLYELLTGSTPLERARLRGWLFRNPASHSRGRAPQAKYAVERVSRLAAFRRRSPQDRAGKTHEAGPRRSRLDCDEVARKRPDAPLRDGERVCPRDRAISRGRSGRGWSAGASYRLSKYARKHRVALVTAGAFVAFLLVAFGLTTWLAVAASRARDQARTALGDAKKAKLATEEALAESENARKEAQAINAFLVTSFGRPDPEQDGAKLLVVDVLDHALAELDDVYPGKPVIKGTLLSALGKTYFGLGQYAKAVNVRTRARDVFEASLGPDSPDTLRSRALLGSGYREAGRPAEAIALLESTLKRQEETQDAGNADIIDTRIELASTYLDVGRPIDAVTLLESTRKLCDAKKDSNDGRASKVRLYLGRAYQDAGNSTDAIKVFESALEELQRSPRPKHSNIPAVRNDLALAYAAAGKTTEVISMHQETLKLIEAAVGRDHPDAIVSRHNLGLAYLDAGRTTEAVELLEETLKLFELKLGPDHPRTLKARDRLTTCYRAQGRIAQAASFAEVTLRLSEAKLGPDHPVTLSCRNTLANAYLDIDKPAEALELNKTTLRIRESKFGRDHPETITSRHNLAWAYRRRQDRRGNRAFRVESQAQ